MSGRWACTSTANAFLLQLCRPGGVSNVRAIVVDPCGVFKHHVIVGVGERGMNVQHQSAKTRMRWSWMNVDKNTTRSAIQGLVESCGGIERVKART